MVVKLSKSQITWNEVYKELFPKEKQLKDGNYIIRDLSDSKKERKELVLMGVKIENNLVRFELGLIKGDYLDPQLFCIIRNNKIQIEDSLYEEDYNLIKPLLENSKFNWEILVV